MKRLNLLGEGMISVAWIALVYALAHWSWGLAWIGMAVWFASLGAKVQAYAKSRAVTKAVTDMARIESESGDVFFDAAARRADLGYNFDAVDHFLTKNRGLAMQVLSRRSGLTEQKLLIVLAQPSHIRLQK